jgi:hypothetical protein
VLWIGDARIDLFCGETIVKNKWIAAIALTLVASVGASAAMAAKFSLDGVKCMMMPAKSVKEDKFVEYKDAKVYFCCPGCVKKFSADSKPFAAKANHQLVLTKQYEQKKCPMSGGDLNPEQSITVGGVKAGFCCGNCKGKAEKMEGDAQVEALFGEEAFKKGEYTLVKEEK